MLQVASKCTPRGTLIKGNGIPHTVSSLSAKCRCPAIWFQAGIEFLTKHTDWVDTEEFAVDCQPGVSEVSADCRQGVIEGRKGMEGKEGKGMEEKAVQPEVVLWNSIAGSCGLPKVAALSPDRATHLSARRRDRFWVENLHAAVMRIAGSSFCLGANDRGWKADFDWLLRPGTVAKVMEGKYDARTVRKGPNI